MKHILILVAVLVLQQAHAARITAEEDQKLTNYATECRTETGVDKDMTEKLRQADDDQDKDKLYAKNDKLKHYIACLCTKLELMNADGLVQKDGLKKMLSRDNNDAALVDKIVDKCAVQKNSAAETAIEMMKCVRLEMTGRLRR